MACNVYRLVASLLFDLGRVEFVNCCRELFLHHPTRLRRRIHSLRLSRAPCRACCRSLRMIVVSLNSVVFALAIALGLGRLPSGLAPGRRCSLCAAVAVPYVVDSRTSDATVCDKSYNDCEVWLSHANVCPCPKSRFMTSEFDTSQSRFTPDNFRSFSSIFVQHWIWSPRDRH